jgi:hypothetical protein
MKRSATLSYAAAGALSITAGLMTVTPAALPGPPTTGVQTRDVRLASGDSELLDVGLASPAVADGYSFAELIESIQNTVGVADGWFSEAPTAFAAGEYPLGLSEELAGFNNLTVGVGNDLLTNGYAVLTASDGNAGYDLINPGQPADFATALTQVHTDLADIQMDLTNAMTDFGSGNDYFGLVELGSVATDSTSATDAIILGLFDSLIGAAVTD